MAAAMPTTPTRTGNTIGASSFVRRRRGRGGEHGGLTTHTGGATIRPKNKTSRRRRAFRERTTSAFFFSPSSSPAANDERDEEKDERGRLSSLTVTVENPTRGADEGNARKNQCTKVVVEGPNRRGELASMASSLTSYGVDIIFAQAEAIGCAVDAYYDASLSSSSSKKKKKKKKKSALNSSTTSPSSSSNAKDGDEDDDEEEEISCAKIIFWVQLNGKMLDVTQQEDLRAFLQASLLPENNSMIDGETSSTQTTEDLFKEYTPELTPEKLSGTYVGTTERVLAKNKEQLSTMPNIYGQAAMSELKLLRKKPNARQLLSSEARKESEAVVRSAQQLELAAAELAASAAALVSIERKSAQLECDLFDEEGRLLSKEAEEKCMKVDEGRSDLRALFERRMAAMEAALATRDRVRDGMRKPSGANGEKSKNAYDDAAAAAALRSPDSPSITVDAEILASEAFQQFAVETDTVVPYLDDLDLRRTRAQRMSFTKEPKKALDDKRMVRKGEGEVEEKDLTVMQPPIFSPLPSTPCGNGKEIILQGFNWESCRSDEKFSQTWYNRIIEESSDIARAGFTAVWMPPPTTSVSEEGYMPTDLYNLNTFYGSEEELKECVRTLHEKKITAVADIVINHRCATKQDEHGRWNVYDGKLAWDKSAICSGNPEFGGTGNPKSGEDYGPAPNIDHSNESIRNDIKEWLNWLRDEIGFRGWRFDFVKGYNGVYSGEYVEATRPFLAFGEYWDTCAYTDGILEYDQRNHRQRTCNWVDASGGNTAAFDFTTKGVLQEACAKGEYWRLMDPDGRPPGLCGIWPSRAVLFLENHDTGSTLQHWPFPTHKLEEGYAYILTHPGTPTIFYDHWTAKETVMVGGTQAANGQLRECIETLIQIRKRVGISSRSAIQIIDSINAQRGYAARIGARRNVNATNKVTEGPSSDLDPDEPSICMKIGCDEWSPNQTKVGGREWKCVASGEGWAVWEDKAFMNEHIS